MSEPEKTLASRRTSRRPDPPVGRSAYASLPEFTRVLERRGLLLRIYEPVSTVLEMTEISRRLLAQGGPALLFERPIRANGQISDIPVLTNLFGTQERVALGLGCSPDQLAAVGDMLAALNRPEPPAGWRDAVGRFPLLKRAISAEPRICDAGPVQSVVQLGDAIDLTRLPIQTCWPGEPAPLITWPLVVTAPLEDGPVNVGVYRMQVLDRRRTLVRWLQHRGGAQHHRQWVKAGRPMPMAVAIGADPATILAAVTPLPDTLSEYHFAGLLRGARPDLVRCRTIPLAVPAYAEIVLEGHVSPDETADEGPYGDHTGYYNSVDRFPVFTLTAITRRRKPIYLSTFTGRPPDEPSVLAEALNQVFVPLLRQQFPEIVDCWLPPEACSYRIAVVSIRKTYPGQARRIMMALWSYLRQFTYTKMVIVVDDEIRIRDWRDVMWAVSTRMDPSRDLLVVDGTPMDHLDFASPLPGLGGKLGIDATRKIGPETTREWAQPLRMDEVVVSAVTRRWTELGLPGAHRPTGYGDDNVH